MSLLLVGGCKGPGTGSKRSRPNLLIVMIDALRADRVGVNGNPRGLTPHIDRLAAEGVNFTQAFSHSTWTKPSVATLFTSLYPSQHGLRAVTTPSSGGPAADVLADRWTTLAERFSAAGYHTGAVINQVHIRARYGFAQGFEMFKSYRGRSAPRLNVPLLDWLRTLGRDRPFFAYLHLLDVHWPYTHRAFFRDSDLGSTALTIEPPASGKEAIEKWGQTLELPADLEALEARYNHEVAFVDFFLGELLDELVAMGRYDNTIVVVTADHGEGFLEHGELLHGHAPWEEMIRVPLVLRLPEGLRGAPQQIDRPIGLIDLMPTLLDLAGLEPEPQGQGLSLGPYLRGESLRPRLVFVESETAAAARSADHKALRFADGHLELFDLLVDPDELHPLAADCGDPCERLVRRLGDFEQAMATARTALDSEMAPIDLEDLEEMRSLGYVD